MKLKIKRSTAKKLGNLKNTILDIILTGILTIGFIILGVLLIWIGINDSEMSVLLFMGIIPLGIGIYLSLIFFEEIFIEYVE